MFYKLWYSPKQTLKVINKIPVANNNKQRTKSRLYYKMKI